MSQPTLLEASSEDGKFGLNSLKPWELIYHRHFEVEENDTREEGSDEEERWSLGLHLHVG